MTSDFPPLQHFELGSIVTQQSSGETRQNPRDVLPQAAGSIERISSIEKGPKVAPPEATSQSCPATDRRASGKPLETEPSRHRTTTETVSLSVDNPVARKAGKRLHAQSHKVDSGEGRPAISSQACSACNRSCREADWHHGSRTVSIHWRREVTKSENVGISSLSTIISRRILPFRKKLLSPVPAMKAFRSMKC